MVGLFGGLGGGVQSAGRFEKKLVTGGCVFCFLLKFLHRAGVGLEASVKAQAILSIRVYRSVYALEFQ